MSIVLRLAGFIAVAALCMGAAQDASAQKLRGPAVGAAPAASGGGRMPSGGGGSGGSGWGGAGAGFAAGVVGGLIMQGIANANTQPPPGYAPGPNSGPPRGNAGRSATGGRGSGVPPAGENRFIPNEVVVEIPNSMPQQVLSGVERRHRLSRLETSRSNLAGTTLLRWRITDARPVPTVIRALEAEGMVAAAQPNYVYSLQQDAQATRQDTATPQPEQVSLPPQQSAVPAQYASAKMNLPQAHGLARGTSVLVAVIDSGIDGSHPDLQGSVAESFNAAVSPADTHAHGTGIAGLIAAHGRITGTAPAARILAVRAFDPKETSAEATTFAILKGLDWAVEKRARVINMSFAGPADPAISRALSSAARKGVVLIAAAGNAGAKSPPLYPAADPNVIAVSASGPDDRLFEQSNRGRHIAVAAPGVDIVAPSTDGGYQVASGTSMAAAEVSGVAALLLERRPNLSSAAVRNILMSTARDLGAPGRDDEFGAGLADALQAVMVTEPKSAGAASSASAR